MDPMRTNFATGIPRAPMNKQGSVLVMALAASTVVLILCAGLIGMIHRTNSGQAHVSDAKEAFHMAEAGLTEAFSGLTLARTGNVGTRELPAGFGDGLFWVESRELDDGTIELESTGMVGSGRATLQLHVKRAELQIGSLGIFGDEELIIPAGAYVDGFDSRLGPYGAQLSQGTTRGRGRVGSNNGLRLEGAREEPRLLWGSTTSNPSTFVDGEATPGPEAEVLISGDAGVSGSTAPRNAMATLPVLASPLPAAESLLYEDTVPLIIPPGDLSFSAIEIEGDSEIVLTGPSTILTETLLAKSGARLLFDTTGGPVDLIVTAWIEFQPQARLETVSEDSTRSSILVASTDNPTDESVRLDASSQFFGSLVAPGANAFIGGSLDFFGAIAARKLTLGPGARLHFDHALADPNLDGSNRPRVVSWRVVDIPLEINNRALSPFDLLGVDRSSLPSPAQAHEDQVLVIDYVDSSGATRTYSGWESLFDWTGVQSVTNATRDGSAVTPVTLLNAQGTSTTQTGTGTTTPTPTLSDLLMSLMDPTADQTTLVDFIIQMSPFSTSFVLQSLIDHDRFTPQDYQRVIEAQGPMTDTLVSRFINNGFLPADLMTTTLIAMSPLGPTSLGLVLDGSAGLTPTQVSDIVAAQ